MNTFRKFWQRSKNQVCAALFTICLISCSLLPASAAEVDTTAKFQGVIFPQVWSGSSWYRGTEVYTSHYPDWFITLPRQNVHDDPVAEWSNLNGVTTGGATFGLSEFSVTAPDDGGFYGNVGLYLNFYVKLVQESGYSLPSGTWTTHDTPLYFTVYDASGKTLDSGEVDYSFYDVTTVAGNVTKGVSCSLKFNAPEAIPAVKIVFNGNGYGKVGWLPSNKSFTFRGTFEYYVPSATLIANVKSAEVEALEDVTNAIIEQNGLTQEKFTEVIGKVDEVYKELGTTNGLLEESMQQFEDWDTVTTVPGSVQDKTDKADQVITDINSLVKPSPDTLVPVIDTDTGDISSVLQPFFSNVMIVQLCTMVLGFAFVSYVLFGKKG